MLVVLIFHFNIFRNKFIWIKPDNIQVNQVSLRVYFIFYIILHYSVNTTIFIDVNGITD